MTEFRLRRRRESVTVVELLAYIEKIDAAPGDIAMRKAAFAKAIGDHLDLYIEDPRPEAAECV